jgi:hypothetical protein
MVSANVRRTRRHRFGRWGLFAAIMSPILRYGAAAQGESTQPISTAVGGASAQKRDFCRQKRVYAATSI